MTSDDDALDLDPDVVAATARERLRSWPGPDLYTLRAWAELNLALERGVTVDAAHALITDAADAVFGGQLYDRVSEALAGEGRDPDDLSALLDDRLCDRVLRRLAEPGSGGDGAPDPPDDEIGWYAYSPDDPDGGRARYRRAVRERKEKARRMLVFPPRRRVTGSRDR